MSSSQHLEPSFAISPMRDPLDSAARLDTWAVRLALCLTVLLAVRIVALYWNETDLFFDEAQYWSWSLDPAFGYYSKPPLIAWIIGFSTSLCGTSEFCVRLPSPIIHTLTAAAVFLAATRLYDPKTGFWAGLIFATLPGVTFSAGIISTDVPLLLFWAIATFSFISLIQNRSALWPGILLGLALGLGLNAKYAMAYFVLCMLIYCASTPEQRWILRDRRWWLALTIGLALIAPNLIWNAQNSFSTFAHTADNAKWEGALFHPGKAAEFFGSQFGVFGPILFGALLVITWRAYHRGLPPPDRLLLAFALPVILIVTVQAFLSRAHANWAAVSYVTAAILVTATMLRDARIGWFRSSLAFHLLLIPAIAFGLANARSLHLPGLTNPFARTLGWKDLGRETVKRLETARARGQPYAAVLTFQRAVTAELLYYMHGNTTPVLTWPPAGRPKDHYQLTRPFIGSVGGPVLFVATRSPPDRIKSHFSAVRNTAKVKVPTGYGAERTIYFLSLSGWR